MTGRLLSIYLNDHMAAATGAAALAGRVAASNRGTAYGQALAELGAEIEQDRASLALIMQRAGIGTDRVKSATAWTAEKLGRLKLNGQITGYSPLSRLEEIEILTLGVSGKLLLWEALREAAPSGVPESELAELIDRARSQRRRLDRLRRRAARDALGLETAPDDSPDGTAAR